MHFSVKRYMHPQLRGLYKIIMSEGSHSNHTEEAPIPGHVRRGRLSSDAHAHIAGLVVQGVPPEHVLSRWHEYLRAQHAACRDFPTQVSRLLHLHNPHAPPPAFLSQPMSAAFIVNKRTVSTHCLLTPFGLLLMFIACFAICRPWSSIAKPIPTLRSRGTSP